MSALAAVDTAAPSAAAASMTLHVKHGKNTYKVDISPSATVDELKIKLEGVAQRGARAHEAAPLRRPTARSQ